MTLRKLLLVTYYFPPCAASGTFRALGFARHLPKFGWQPIVVAPPRIPWEPVDEGLSRQVPADTPVYRAPYPQGRVHRLLQRFVAGGVWWPRALAACARAVREHQPDAVLTTSPPHGVHLLGRILNLRHGLPWVADFRDPWAAANWQGARRGLRGWWDGRCERLVIGSADAVVANAPRACEGLQAAYPEYRHKMVAITNGYDPESFPAPAAVPVGDRRLTVVHAGELYAGRDPRPLLDALRDLARGGRPLRLYLLGRAEGVGFDLAAEIRQRGLGDAVDFSGQVPYGRAVAEMAAGDILLLLDTPGRRIGIPAKLYEYLGAGRPILALAEPDGDTAWALRESGVLHRIAPLTDAARIGQALTELSAATATGQATPAPGPQRFAFTRERLAQSLAECLNACVAPAAGAGLYTGGPRVMTTNGNGRRLRVAHVSWGLNVGGLEKLLVEFARHTDRTRFDLRFVSLTARGTLAADLERLGWPVTALEEPDGLRPGLVLRLAQLFRGCGADVVHTHDERPLLYAAAGARLARVPRVVHTRHGQKARNTRRQVVLFRMAALLADRVACVSDDAAAMTVREGVARQRVCTVRNGIDLARFAFAGPAPDGPVVTVARLSPEKDVATLVRAAAVAVRQRPSFRLEVAGAGVCMPSLKQLTAELGLEAHVHFHGEVRDVASLLGRAGLFVLPSIEEGISLTLLEAMARGLPVVATRIGGNPEVVVDGETGLLVPARDPDAMARALLRVLGNPEEGQRMGRAGRRRVESLFDVRRMVATYEALYCEAATARAPARAALVT